MKFPLGTIWYGSNGNKIDIYDLLGTKEYPDDSKKKQARDEILACLNEIGYHKN